jgi:hypothetical protein
MQERILGAGALRAAERRDMAEPSTKRAVHARSTVRDVIRATLYLVDWSPLSGQVAQKLGQAFGVTAAEVLADADTVARWDGQLDDLLVFLEHRHTWVAERALKYLVSLRTALAGEYDTT